MAKKLKGTRILITGAGGFIGSHLVEHCLRQGGRVRAFVHYNSRNDRGMLRDLPRRTLDRVEVVAGDLRDYQAVLRAARGCGIVLHLGALIGIPYSYGHPGDVVATNVLGTLNVLQACLDAGVERMVQTSTSEVYGTAKYVPMDEEHPLNPQSPYAASKVAADKLAESYHRSYGLPVAIVRPYNTYGPRQSQRAVVPAIITQALRSSRIRLGRLDTTRDLTYVSDTVRGFAAAAVAPESPGRTVHIGSGREVSIAELVKMVGSILGKKLVVERQKVRLRPETSEVERLVCSNDRARKVLGWTPRVRLEEGLERTVRWFHDRADLFGSEYQV